MNRETRREDNLSRETCQLANDRGIYCRSELLTHTWGPRLMAASENRLM